MSTGKRIKERREAVGLKQIELANRIGHKAGSHLCRIEKGKTDSRGSMLDRIWAEIEKAEREQAHHRGREAKRHDEPSA